MIRFFELEFVIKILPPLLLILGCFVLGIICEKRVIKKLKTIAQKNQWVFPEILLNSIRGISVLWLVLLGVFLSLPSLPLNENFTIIIEKFISIIFLSSATLVIARLSVYFLRIYTTQDNGISPLTTLFEFLTKVVIFSIGILIIFQSVGISITPLLTAFGVGGVSIGLALQNTLSNLMSGINIITSGKVKPGNYIQLDTGESGYVKDVELKYTVVEEITNNILVIPNSKIITSNFRNFSLPDKYMFVPLEIGISYDSDLEKVEKITLEVAQELIKIPPNTEKQYQPFIRYQNFDYYSIKLTVYLIIKEEEFFEHIKIKHKFIKKLHQRYQQEDIKMAYPIQLGYLPMSDNT